VVDQYDGCLVVLFPVRRWRMPVLLHCKTAASRYTITRTTARLTVLEIHRNLSIDH
jgi:hypothetical protein